MVGSILGTFLTGFFLIEYLGTKGVLLALGTVLALGATFLGELFHAVWAGIPLGLCVIAFTPPGWVDVSRGHPSINGKSFAKMGEDWGVREPMGDPDHDRRGLRLGRRERLLLHQGRERAGGRRRDPAADARARQPDPRLFHPQPSRAARLRLRAHLCPGRLSRRQGRRPGEVQAGLRGAAGRRNGEPAGHETGRRHPSPEAGRAVQRRRRARPRTKDLGPPEKPAEPPKADAEARQAGRAAGTRQGLGREARARLPERRGGRPGRQGTGRDDQRKGPATRNPNRPPRRRSPSPPSRRRRPRAPAPRRSRPRRPPRKSGADATVPGRSQGSQGDPRPGEGPGRGEEPEGALHPAGRILVASRRCSSAAAPIASSGTCSSPTRARASTSPRSTRP